MPNTLSRQTGSDKSKQTRWIDRKKRYLIVAKAKNSVPRCHVARGGQINHLLPFRNTDPTVFLIMILFTFILLIDYCMWLETKEQNQHWHTRFMNSFTYSGIRTLRDQGRRQAAVSGVDFSTIDLATVPQPKARLLQQPRKVSEEHDTAILQQSNDKKQVFRLAVANATSLPEGAPGDESHLWYNDHNVVHVIETRFMQHQPSLVHLARARLLLFQTATLPSMKKQEQQCGGTYCFLWLLRIDPDLDDSILQELTELTLTVENLIVLASNDNPRAQFRQIAPDERLVVSGSFALWQAYHKAAQKHVVLETRLDADDALGLDFIKRLQLDAAQEFNTGGSTSSKLRRRQESRPWLVWCVQDHWEWQQYASWNSSNPRGGLSHLHTRYCVTPGLTWGFPPHDERWSASIQAQHLDGIRSIVFSSDLTPTKISHHLIHKLVPHCLSNGEITRVGCLRYLGAGGVRNKAAQNSPTALRLRTITSAGMGNMVLKEGIPPTGGRRQAEQLKLTSYYWKVRQRQMWNQMPDLFGMNQSSIEHMRAELEAGLSVITADAEQGQCTPGHSCKEEAQEALQALRKHALTT